MNEAQGNEQSFWRSPMTWLAFIQIIVAYEWLVSGANKLLAGNFPHSLRGILNDALQSNPNRWDVGWLRSVVLPCCTWFGGMVECGETLVGIALVASALIWLGGDRLPVRVRRWSAWLSAAACIAGALMAFNFYVATGGTFPFLSSANAGNEGVSIDVVILLLSLALAAAHLSFAPRGVARARAALAHAA